MAQSGNKNVSENKPNEELAVAETIGKEEVDIAVEEATAPKEATAVSQGETAPKSKKKSSKKEVYLLDHEDEVSEDISLEPEKKTRLKRTGEDCKFYDNKLVSVATKYGYMVFLGFVGLSILFSILNVDWYKNALNVLFMSFAMLSYAIQKTIEFVYSKKCACEECKSEFKPLITRMIFGYALFVIGCVCFGVFYGEIMN